MENYAYGAKLHREMAGLTGNGAIKQAWTQRDYCISVDVDAYDSVFESGTAPGVEYLLTSILKRIDNAVYDTIVAHVNDTFTWDAHITLRMVVSGWLLSLFQQILEVIAYLEVQLNSRWHRGRLATVL